MGDELCYDKYNLKADRIFRITENVKLNNQEASYAGSEKPLKEALKSFPDMEKIVRIIPKETLFKTPQKFYNRIINIKNL